MLATFKAKLLHGKLSKHRKILALAKFNFRCDSHFCAKNRNLVLISTFSKRFIINHLMAQWVDMEALRNKNHASLSCFFDCLDTVRQISSLESASSGGGHAVNA